AALQRHLHAAGSGGRRLLAAAVARCARVADDPARLTHDYRGRGVDSQRLPLERVRDDADCRPPRRHVRQKRMLVAVLIVLAAGTALAGLANTIVRTIGGAIGSQVTAGIVTATVAAKSLPTENGFTIAFAASAAALAIGFVVALTVPARDGTRKIAGFRQLEVGEWQRR